MSHEHERAVAPFADIHRTGDMVIATLLHDPTVEGLEMAVYLDGSGSMKDEYDYPEPKTGLFDWLFGSKKPDTEATNIVEPQARWILSYLATKDRNGILRTAYWACGQNGQSIEPLGEIRGVDAERMAFTGPRQYGDSTRLAPAIRDFLTYMRQKAKEGAQRGCAVFITDGVIHDEEEVEKLTEQIEGEIERGKLVPLNFVLVGVGESVDEEQMEKICHSEHAGESHLWCHRVAAEITQMAELVAVLVDETMTVAGGGVVYDDNGRVLQRYEGRLPAVLKFDIGDDARAFVLEVGGKKYRQPLPAAEDHDDDHH